MEVYYFSLFLLLLTVAIVLELATHTFSSSSTGSSVSPAPSSSLSGPLVVRLLYTQSPAYPGFDPNSTIQHIAYLIEKASQQRISYLNYAYEMKYKEQADGSGETVHVSIMGSTGDCSFVAEMHIGDPAVQIFPMMDTGSSLFWVKDKSVIIGKSDKNIQYSSEDSNSYYPLSCKNKFCTRELFGKCQEDNTCRYFVRYGSMKQFGTLAEENFHMGDPVAGVDLEGIVFGSARNQLDKSNSIFQYNGILGLGESDVSLPIQLASRFGDARFSYCLGKMNSGNISDPYSHLSFGTNSSLEGDSTPYIHGVHYEVTLNGITISKEGEKARSLPIDSQSAFRTEYGTVLDNGSPFSYIVSDAYDALMYEVQRAMSDLGLKEVESPGRDLCYKANLENVTGFPTFRFQFDGGAEMLLGIESLFYQLTSKAICLSVQNSDNYVSQFAFGYGVYNLIEVLHSKIIT